MSHRPVKNKDFANKTIKRVDARAVNVIKFYFTDGTALALETEAMGYGIIGIVTCDACVSPPVRRPAEPKLRWNGFRPISRRKHSRDGQIYCTICAPLRCKRAS